MNKNSKTWDEVKKEVYSNKRIKDIDIETRFLCQLIELRNKNNISQKQLEKMCGIKQPMLTRIEKGESMPRIDTLMRILGSMGMTLKIVPIENN